jgi:hypothetical protein
MALALLGFFSCRFAIADSRRTRRTVASHFGVPSAVGRFEFSGVHKSVNGRLMGLRRASQFDQVDMSRPASVSTGRRFEARKIAPRAMRFGERFSEHVM